MSRAHREYFNRIAPDWNTMVPEVPILRDYMIRLGVSKGDCVLDVGAGTGRLTSCLAELVTPEGQVVAVDIADKMLKIAQRSICKNHVTLLCSDVCELALRNNLFDKAVCFSILPHVMNILTALTEIYRTLRPGGKLLVLHIQGSQQLNAFHGSLDGIVNQDVLPSAPELELLAEDIGFSSISTTETEDLYWVEMIKPTSSLPHHFL